MKSLMTTFLLFFTGYIVLAQCDPRLTAFNVAKSPIALNEITNFTLTFGVGNNSGCNGSGTLRGAAGSIRINVSFNENAHPENALVSGSLAPYFTWTYNVATFTLSGINSSPIPVGDALDLTIPAKGVSSTEELPGGTNYTTANWASESDIPISNVSNANDTPAPVPLSVSKTPLPVKLMEFTAKAEGEIANLFWTTTEESNSDRFEIEHSVNAKTWDAVGSVQSHGESSVLQKYSFIHEEPLNGTNFYRLKMIDLDGSFAFSKIQSVKFEGIQEKSMVYPNPASDLVKISAKDLTSVKSIRMYDLGGKTVYSARGNSLSRNIDVKSMSPGNYIVEMISTTGQVKTSKIVIFR